MTNKEYMMMAMKTKGEYANKVDQLLNGVMGLCGESGEVIDMVKKHVYQGHNLDRVDMIDELGDVLWYIHLILDVLGCDLEDIQEYNINKLSKRYPKGFFRKEDSVNREE